MCESTPEAQLELAADPTSPTRARRWAKATGCLPHALALADDALLLISELVTNAVRHGAAPIMLGIECQQTAIHVRVRDASTAPPVRRQPDQHDEGGRGLELLELIADEWGVQPTSDRLGNGKQVWFVLKH